MRDALTQLSGELAGGDGDRLYERVAAERGALLDARNSRPKGVYKEAEDALARATAERDEDEDRNDVRGSCGDSDAIRPAHEPTPTAEIVTTAL